MSQASAPWRARGPEERCAQSGSMGPRVRRSDVRLRRQRDGRCAGRRRGTAASAASSRMPSEAKGGTTRSRQSVSCWRNPWRGASVSSVKQRGQPDVAAHEHPGEGIVESARDGNRTADEILGAMIAALVRRAVRGRAGPWPPNADWCPAPRSGAAPSLCAPRAADRSGGSAASCDLRGLARWSNQSSTAAGIELVGEAAAGLERALHEVLQPLDAALGLRSPRNTPLLV
jgi:hypothetical protein